MLIWSDEHYLGHVVGAESRSWFTVVMAGLDSGDHRVLVQPWYIDGKLA